MNLADRRLATLDKIAKMLDEAGVETFPRHNDYSDLIERVRELIEQANDDGTRCTTCNARPSEGCGHEH